MVVRRSTAVCFLLLALTFAAPTALAARFADLYDDATLEHWQPRYREGVLWNLDNAIRPRLTPAEQAALSRLRLDFPLRGQEDHPLSFYAIAGGVVTLPVLSLKFFDDLSVAFAWLQRKGYVLQTPLEYVSMLKYASPGQFGGSFPPPLLALRIPEDALTDPAVDDLAQKIFKSAVVFVLLHEMGHVLHGHPGYGPKVARADARANEAEADAFAMDMMRRLGAAPSGMAPFFQALAHSAQTRGDFPSEAEYDRHLADSTHPLTEDRLRAVAAAMQANVDAFAQEFATLAGGREAVRFMAGEIAKVADFLGDRDMQRVIAEIGRNTTLASLAPRRPGETLGAPSAATRSAATAAAPPFDGVYDGVFAAGGVELPVRMILRREGELVAGQYSYGVGIGRLLGEIRGGRLLYEWEAQGDRGRGVLTATPDGALAGHWGIGDSDDDGGTVSGRRLSD